MTNTTKIYCHNCQRQVIAIKTLVVSCCPHCGDRFTPSQFVQSESKKPIRREPETDKLRR